MLNGDLVECRGGLLYCENQMLKIKKNYMYALLPMGEGFQKLLYILLQHTFSSPADIVPAYCRIIEAFGLLKPLKYISKQLKNC